MPFLVTTKRSVPYFGEIAEEETQRAVATLEEAQLIVGRELAHVAAAVSLPESGCSILLPDGTVIEVTPTTISDIADTFSMDTFNRMNYEGAAEADWIAAYNAKQAA